MSYPHTQINSKCWLCEFTYYKSKQNKKKQKQKHKSKQVPDIIVFEKMQPFLVNDLLYVIGNECSLFDVAIRKYEIPLKLVLSKK